MNHSDTTRASRRSILSGGAAVLLLAGPAVAAEAIGASETPFPSIEALCAKIDALNAQREEAWMRLSELRADGHRYCGNPEYLRISDWVLQEANKLTMQVSRIEARTPHEVRLKAKLCSEYVWALPWDMDKPSTAILASLYRDLGVV